MAIAAVLFSSHALALGDQYSYYGLTLNYAYSQQKQLTTKPETGTYQMLNGFNAGFMFQQQLYKGLVLVSGLQYQFTMAKSENDDADSYLMSHNLRVPVKFGFTTPFAGNWSFTVFGGPSLDFNVAMIEKMKLDNGDYNQYDFVNGVHKYDIEGYSDSETDDEFKKLNCFDVPLGIGTIVKYKNFGMKFEYEWGMINRLKDSDDDEEDLKYKTDQFSIGFFYTF
ncbi:MAG: PorT family protein [Paludibacteraceae bacterium]|nr:PorT family protein [Paludibacteraceae bacterium]